MLTSFYQLQATTRRNPFILSPLRRSTSSGGPTLRNMTKSHEPQRPFVFHCPVLDHHCSPFLHFDTYIDLPASDFVPS